MLIMQGKEKWKQEDSLYKGCLLNAMADNLFDMYEHMEIAKEFGAHAKKSTRWKILEKRVFW